VDLLAPPRASLGLYRREPAGIVRPAGSTFAAVPPFTSAGSGRTSPSDLPNSPSIDSPRVLPALADPLSLVAGPGAARFHDVLRVPRVEQVAFLGNASLGDNVEFHFPGRRHPLVVPASTLVRLPITSSPSWRAARRRISSRTEE
jgi:hypothetical protein